MAELGIVIRTAVPADAPYLADMATRMFHTAFATNNNPEDIAAYVAEAFGEDTILQELEDPRSRFILAVQGSTNIGYAKTNKGTAPDCVAGSNPIQLDRLYVDANHQSAGVGATLLQAVLDYARGEGFGIVWLSTWEKNPKARKFYEREGFSVVGSKYFMVGNDRQNDVVMSRILG